MADQGIDAQARVEREREFHDARFSADERSANRFYQINAASNQFFKQAIEATPSGSDVLDYGCGEGAYVALHAAQHGHRVTAFDISPVAIEHARREAESQGVASRINFRTMNAEDLDLEPESFDLVCGLGVIHHLDVEAAIHQIARVTRPEGRAVFVEPLGHNPLINLYRRRTPSQRSEDEHPLLVDDLDALEARFSSTNLTYFHLLGLLALPAVGRSRFPSVLKRLDQADQMLFRTPARRWAWMVGIETAGPRLA